MGVYKRRTARELKRGLIGAKDDAEILVFVEGTSMMHAMQLEDVRVRDGGKSVNLVVARVTGWPETAAERQERKGATP